MEFVIDNTSLSNVSASGIEVTLSSLSVVVNTDNPLTSNDESQYSTYTLVWSESETASTYRAGRIFIIFDDGSIEQTTINNVYTISNTHEFEKLTSITPQALIYSSYQDNDDGDDQSNDGDEFSTIEQALLWAFNGEQLTISNAATHYYSGLNSVISGDFISKTQQLEAPYINTGNDLFLVNSYYGQTFYGGEGDDALFGSYNGDILYGEAGNDSINGAAGGDYMAGGIGDDTYYVDSLSDLVVEPTEEGAGNDTVISTTEYYTLEAGIESLELAENAISGFGNELDNTITGNELNNILAGHGGNDTIDGAGGNDTAYYHGNADEFTLSINGADVLVTGPDGNDTLTNIESIKFKDTTIAVDSINVADGYIAGADIYVDLNANGIADQSEATGLRTDAKGNFIILGNIEGNLLAVGGVNSDTNLTNNLTLSAPKGASVINPLTSLIVSHAALQGMSITEAESQINQLTVNDSDIDLLHYDPLANNDNTGLVAQKIAAQLASVGTIASTQNIDFSTILSIASDNISQNGKLGNMGDLYTSVLNDVSVSKINALVSSMEQSNSFFDISMSQLNNLAFAEPATLSGTDQDDYLIGNEKQNILFGEDGHDHITGSAGNDSIHGGEGNDYIEPGSGSDLVIGGAGFDTLKLDFNFQEASFSASINGKVTLSHLSDIDTLAGIERLIFNDESVVDIIDVIPEVVLDSQPYEAKVQAYFLAALGRSATTQELNQFISTLSSQNGSVWKDQSGEFRTDGSLVWYLYNSEEFQSLIADKSNSQIVDEIFTRMTGVNVTDDVTQSYVDHLDKNAIKLQGLVNALLNDFELMPTVNNSLDQPGGWSIEKRHELSVDEYVGYLNQLELIGNVDVFNLMDGVLA